MVLSICGTNSWPIRARGPRRRSAVVVFGPMHSDTRYPRTRGQAWSACSTLMTSTARWNGSSAHARSRLERFHPLVGERRPIRARAGSSRDQRGRLDRGFIRAEARARPACGGHTWVEGGASAHARSRHGLYVLGDRAHRFIRARAGMTKGEMVARRRRRMCEAHPRPRGHDGGRLGLFLALAHPRRRGYDSMYQR